ncbi:MAG: tyrosine-type recombinase/integrase [Parachlamydiaceae bacterium]
MSKMGHLRKRKDKNGKMRYRMIVEVWKDGKKFYKSKTCDSEKAALKWGNRLRCDIDKGLVTKESLKNRKLSDALDRYIEEVLVHKPKNARNVSQHLNWWKEQLGRYQLGEITPLMVAECRDSLFKEPTHQNKQRAPATIVRYLSSLSAVFEIAIKEWHWIEKNPLKLIRKPTVSNARTRFLSEEECKNLLSGCKESRNPYLYSIVVIGLTTGMRRGEILGMRWEDIDFEKKLILLPKTKNGSVRYVPMAGITFQILKQVFSSETILDYTHHVFPSLNTERYLDIRTAWLFALKRAGITNFKFHDLRHSCASFLAMSGATQRDITEILGHRDMRMTHRYSHLAQNHLAETLE